MLVVKLLLLNLPTCQNFLFQFSCYPRCGGLA